MSAIAEQCPSKGQEKRKVRRVSDLTLPRGRAMTDVTSIRPLRLTKISSDSRIKEHKIAAAPPGRVVRGLQDYPHSVDLTAPPRGRSGTIPWKPVGKGKTTPKKYF